MKLLITVLLFISFSSWSQINSEKLIYETDSLLERGEYMTVLAYCNKMIEDDSQSDIANFLLSKLNMEMGNSFLALDYINKAINFNSNESKYYLQRAKINTNNKKAELLFESDLRKAIKYNPLCSEVYYVRSLKFSKSLSFGYAFEEIIKAISIDSLSSIYNLEKINILYKMGKGDQALEEVNKLISNLEPNPDFILLRSEIFLSQSNFIDACNDYSMILNLSQTLSLSELVKNKIEKNCDSTNVKFYYYRSVNYIENLKFDEAISCLSIAQGKFPNNTLFPFLKGFVFQQTGKLELMKIELNKSLINFFQYDTDYLAATYFQEYLKKMLVLEPENDILIAINGGMMLVQNNYLGMGELNRAININPTNSTYYLVRALYTSNNGIESDRERAKKDYEKSISLNPNNALNYYYYGLYYFSEEDLESTIYNFKVATELDTTKALYSSELSNVYQAVGDMYSALYYVDKAIHLDSFNCFLYATRGVIRYEIGDINGSCEDLHISLDICGESGLLLNVKQEVELMINRYCDSTSLDYYFERGIANYNLGNFDDVLFYYNKALLFNENRPLVLLNRGNYYLAIGEFEMAINDYNECLSLKSDLKTDLKTEFEKIGEPYDLNNVLQLYISSLYVNIADANCGLGRYKEGLKWLDKSTKIIEQSYDINASVYLSDNENLYGQIYWALGNLKSAKVYFRKAIKSNEFNAIAYYNLSMLTLEKAKVYQKNKTTDDYELFIQSAINGVEFVEKAPETKKKGALVKAKKMCDSAIEIDPYFAMAYLLRAQIKILLNEVDYCADVEFAEEFGIMDVATILDVNCE